MKKKESKKNKNFMYNSKTLDKNNNVEFSDEFNKENIDTSSNYQDMDQIIAFSEKTLKKRYPKNRN